MKMSGQAGVETNYSPGILDNKFLLEQRLSVISDKKNLNNSFEDESSHNKSKLDSINLLDVDNLSLDDEPNWLYSKKSTLNTSSNAINWAKEELDKPKVTTFTQSPLKRSMSGKIEKFDDFGKVTQVIGVPPLSASNKDLSTVGKDLSIKPQKTNQEPQRPSTPPLTDDPLQPPTSLGSGQSTSNSNLLYGSGYVFQNLAEVQNAAKLQEQSLRMSFSTPLVNSKGYSLHQSNGKLTDMTQNKLALKNSKTVSKSTTGSLRRPGTQTKSPGNRTSLPPSEIYHSNRELTKRMNAKPANTTEDPMQKSLPNLTRRQPLTSRGTSSRNSAMPTNMGPPIRTASQPAVANLRSAPKSLGNKTSSSMIKGPTLSRPAENPRMIRSNIKTNPSSTSTTRGVTSRTNAASGNTMGRQLPTNPRQTIQTRTSNSITSNTNQRLNTISRLNTTSRMNTTMSKPSSTTPRQNMGLSNKSTALTATQSRTGVSSRLNTTNRLNPSTSTNPRNPNILSRIPTSGPSRNNPTSRLTTTRQDMNSTLRANQRVSSIATNSSSLRGPMSLNQSRMKPSSGTTSTRVPLQPKQNSTTQRNPRVNSQASPSQPPSLSPIKRTSRLLPLAKTPQRTIEARSNISKTQKKTEETWQEGCF